MQLIFERSQLEMELAQLDLRRSQFYLKQPQLDPERIEVSSRLHERIFRNYLKKLKRFDESSWQRARKWEMDNRRSGRECKYVLFFDFIISETNAMSWQMIKKMKMWQQDFKEHARIVCSFFSSANRMHKFISLTNKQQHGMIANVEKRSHFISYIMIFMVAVTKFVIKKTGEIFHPDTYHWRRGEFRAFTYRRAIRMSWRSR